MSGVRGRGQPPVLILIENASVEEVERAYGYIRIAVHVHARTNTNTDATPDNRRQRESASAPANVPGEPWYEGVIQFDTPTHA